MPSINRELIQATLLTYSTQQNEYGEIRRVSPSQTTIEITKPKLFSHNQTTDISFQDVTHTSLSFNKSITEKNEIMVGSTTYLVNFVNNDGRISQLFLIEKS